MSETVLVERHDNVLLARLNRPEALNALNTELCGELVAILDDADRDPVIGAIVITGSRKAFAAGADVKEMAGKDFAAIFSEDWFAERDRIPALRTPTIAAVAG